MNRRSLVTSLSLTFLLLSGILLSACSQKMEASKEAAPAAPPAASVAMDKSVSFGAAAGGNKAAEPAATAGRKLVVTYNLTVVVIDLPKAYKTVLDRIDAAGGYVSVSNMRIGDNGQQFCSLSFRVPPGRSSAVLDEIRKTGRLTQENVTRNDITEEYVDVEARIKNMRTSEARLQQMMSRTGKLEEVLNVQQELARVQGEIDSMEARRKSMETLTEMVTVELTLTQDTSAIPKTGSVFAPIGRAFDESTQALANSLYYLIVFIVAILPWVVLAGLVYYLVKRYGKRFKKPGADV